MSKTILTKKILYWYDNNKRELPWRKKNSQIKREYYTLVSEFMLQQTQVTTVIPYFNNFIKNIPNLTALSKINESKLLKYWEGLGYYSRVKNLKKTANIVKENFNGRLPRTIDELKLLPGIGDYTANAIMAIAFNKSFMHNSMIDCDHIFGLIDLNWCHYMKTNEPYDFDKHLTMGIKSPSEALNYTWKRGLLWFLHPKRCFPWMVY